MIALSYSPEVYDELVAQMDERPEQVAFMLAVDIGRGVFRVNDLRVVDAHRFSRRSDDHAEPDDEIRGEMIQWAWQHDACLVEAHSHGRGFVPARFSGFDFAQFEEWIPHVRWRLRNRPYFALVTAGAEIDGLAWIGEAAQALERILVDGRDHVCPSGASIAYLRA